MGLGFALWQLLRPSPGLPALPKTEDLDRAEKIVSAQPYADANLVLMGDKHLLFSESGKAFVMFGRQGRSWISLFGPVGDVLLRFNFATPRPILEDALQRLDDAFADVRTGK